MRVVSLLPDATEIVAGAQRIQAAMAGIERTGLARWRPEP